jgi:DNA polymerase-3 subunit gamma/tau
LDQLISFCSEQIQETDVLAMFGLAAPSQIRELSRALLAGETETALRRLDDLTRQGKELGRLLSDLLGHFRNLLLYQVGRGDLQLLEVSEAEAAALAAQAKDLPTESLVRILDVLSDYEGRLREAPSKRILLEVALLKTIEARHALSIDTVLQHLQQARLRGTEAVPATAAALPSPPARAAAAPSASEAPAPAATAPPAPTAAPPPDERVEAGPLESLWTAVLDAVGRVSPFTRSYLLEAHPVAFQQQLLTIGFDPEFADHLELVDNGKNRALIQTKLAELGYGDAQVKFVKADAPARSARPPAAAPAAVAPQPAPAKAPSRSKGEPPPADRPPKAEPAAARATDFKNDPLIQKALETFKGQIVDIRA